MGIIIDTKAEEAAQPNLQPVCNQLATDTISRQAAIDEALTFLVEYCGAAFDEDMQKMLCERLDALPSVQPEIIMCNDCEHHRQNHHGDSWCGHPKGLDGFELKPTDFCSAAERRTNERKTE